MYHVLKLFISGNDACEGFSYAMNYLVWMVRDHADIK